MEINSIGCPTCRAKYYDALRSYFAARKDELCDTCQGRLERNPMRILDCKSPVCQEIAKDAPAVTDYLCDECREHFDKVQSYLKAQNIDYTVNPALSAGWTITPRRYLNSCPTPLVPRAPCAAAGATTA